MAITLAVPPSWNVNPAAHIESQNEFDFGIVLGDSTPQTGMYRVRLAATNGSILLRNGEVGLTRVIEQGVPNGAADYTMEGSLADLQTAMGALRYEANSVYWGTNARTEIFFYYPPLGQVLGGTTLINIDRPAVAWPQAFSINEDAGYRPVPDIEFTYDNAHDPIEVTAHSTIGPIRFNFNPGIIGENTPHPFDANDFLAVGVTVVSTTTDPGTGEYVLIKLSGTAAALTALYDKFEYKPNPNHFGAGHVQFHVEAANGNDHGALLPINVLNTQDPPVANADSASTPEDGGLVFNVLTNDTDPDNDTLTLVTTALTSGQGTVTHLPTGEVTFVPAENWYGIATISYTMSDGNGGSAIGIFTVTVTAINDAPVVTDENTTTPVNTAQQINVLTNDTDVDSVPLTITAATLVVGQGNITFDTAGNIAYTPANNFFGTAQVNYLVDDGDGETVTGVWLINVVTSATPIAHNDNYDFQKNEVPRIINFVAENDDVGSIFTVIDTLPTNGSLRRNGVPVTINTNYDGGVWTYQPNNDYTGNDAFTYHTIHSGWVLTNVATVSIVISSDNEPPVALNDGFTFNQDTTRNVMNLLANDSDPDGDNVTFHANTLPTNGLLEVSSTPGGPIITAVINTPYAGEIYFTPTPGFSGNATFDYYLIDVEGNQSVDADVILEIQPVITGPEIVPVDDTFIGVRDVTVSMILEGNDLNLENFDYKKVALEFMTLPANGYLVSPDDLVRHIEVGDTFGREQGNNSYADYEDKGYFIFVPDALWTGTTTFTYRYQNKGIPTAVTATVTIIINPPTGNPGSRCVSNSCVANRAKFVLAPVGGFSFTTDSTVLKSDFDRLRTYINLERTARDAHGKISLQAFDMSYDDIEIIVGNDMVKMKSMINNMVGVDPVGYPDSTVQGLTDVYNDEGFRSQMVNILNKLNQLRQDCICNGDCGANSWCNCHGHCSNCSDY